MAGTLSMPLATQRLLSAFTFKRAFSLIQGAHNCFRELQINITGNGMRAKAHGVTSKAVWNVQEVFLSF